MQYIIWAALFIITLEFIGGITVEGQSGGIDRMGLSFDRGGRGDKIL